MEVEFQVTSRFEKDMEQFSPRDQEIIENKINFFARAFEENPAAIHVYSHKIHFPFLLKPGLTPSLQVLKVSKDIRLIATFDSDPIFDQVIITLLACVRHDQYEREFLKIAEQLYEQVLLNENQEDEAHDEN